MKVSRAARTSGARPSTGIGTNIAVPTRASTTFACGRSSIARIMAHRIVPSMRSLAL
jgi:hypothetical protein